MPDQGLLSEHSKQVLAKARGQRVLVPILPSVPDGRSAESRKANPKQPPTQAELLDALGIPKRVAPPAQAEIMDAAGIPKGPIAVPTGTEEKPPQPKRPSILEFAKSGGLPGAKKAQETPPLKPLVEKMPKLPPAVTSAAETASMVIPAFAGVSAGKQAIKKIAEEAGAVGKVPKKPLTKPAAAKEPWQMTVAQFEEATVGKPIIYKGAGTRPHWFVRSKKGTQEFIDRNSASTHEAGLRMEAQFQHEDSVKRAISEGEAVSSEVLAAYPDITASAKGIPTLAEGRTLREGFSGMPDSFEITDTSGSRVIGHVRNADFPGEGGSLTRGELFFVEVPEELRRTGIGRSLADDALRLMQSKGAQTVNIDATTAEGQALVRALIRDRSISPAFRTSQFGKNEHHILLGKPVASEALGPAAKPAQATEGTVTSDDLIRKAQSPKAPVGARRTPQEVSESVNPNAATLREAPTGAKAAAGQASPSPSSAAPPTKPPVRPPVATGDVPPVEPVLPRPRTLADMNREAKGMRAMTPEQRAAVMDVAQPIEGDVIYQARPFNEHAQNLLGSDTGFNKALRGVPGVKQLFGAWNPAAMARDNPVAMIGLRQGIFQEIEKSRVRFATLRWWNEADDAFGFKRTGTAFGLRPARGIWRATKVQPSSTSVERGRMFGTINDIIEHPERYALNDAQKKALALADNTLTQSVRDAQRAGVNVVELAEAYWPRSVTKGPQGEKGFAGVRRRVSGAKGYTHQRVFADVDDLVKAGFEVETDPRRVFAARLEAGIDTIAQANARKQIAALPGVEKPLERMSRKFPETLESATQARAARDAAKTAVVKAGAKATPEEVLALRQAEADYITAMREVFAKKIEAGAPGYYELRLPSGRIAPQELVEEVGKFIDLPELRQGATGGAARITQEVSQLLRATLTNVDLAAGFIQGQSLFYRNNIAWWKAQGHSVVSLIDDPTAYVAKNFDLIDEGVRAGAIVAPTEFLFAKQGIASIPLRIPYTGSALGSFNRAFEWFITAGQTELYKAARSGAFKASGMDELASLGSAIRKEVGTESYAILGIRPNQRTMEALALFAARFFRANVGLLGQSFSRGPGGVEARKAVGSLIAGGAALTIGIHWAQTGKMPNMTDPYAEDWMQFRIGDTYFSAFGPFYGYFRTLARMSVALETGDAMKAATEAKKFLQSKESLPLRAIDIGGQLVYYGSANVYGTKIENKWDSIAKGILSEFVTPISAQEIPTGIAEGRPEMALGAIGLTGRPVRNIPKKRTAPRRYKSLGGATGPSSTPVPTRRYKSLEPVGVK